jgi:cytolysin-activating lysine-acyltransferase
MNHPLTAHAKETMSVTLRPAEPATQPKTVSQMLGEITWLLTQSPMHRQLFLGDLEWFVMPPLLMEQYRIFYGPDRPAGVALHARVGAETDARLRQGGVKLRPDEWKSGDIPWLIELVAPFGGQQEMMADLAANVFPGTGFSFHHVDADGKRVVDHFPAVKLDA